MDNGSAVAAASAAVVISFILTYFLTPVLIRFLISKGKVVKDFHKPGKPDVPRPGGYAVIVGIVAAEIVAYLLTFSSGILAIMLSTIIGFIVGYIDDKKTMSGYFKPAALIVAALPIILLGTYNSELAFPLFGAVRIPLLYIGVIVVMIPIMGNTVNSIDVFNGVVSGVMIIATIPLIIAFVLQNKIDMLAATLPLLFTALAFYKYHKNPSKIFPGDSGTLLWGVMYGAIAIVGGVEVIAVVALLPAIINSFMFLASVKKIVEHRAINIKPTLLLEDYRIMASKDKNAPVSLVRLILANGPLTESQIANSIFKLTMFSAGLSILTTLLMVVKV